MPKFKEQRARVISLDGSGPQRLADPENAPAVACFYLRCVGADAYFAQEHIPDPANPAETDGLLVTDDDTEPSDGGRITADNCNGPILDGESYRVGTDGGTDLARTPYHLGYLWVDAADACKIYVTWDHVVER